MTEIERLAKAIKVISEKYLTAEVKAGDREAIGKWSTRLADYSTRLAALVAPPLTLDEKADLDVPDPLSSNPGVAIAQILAATGHPMTFGPSGETLAIDPASVLAAATPEQVKQLALLGFFGNDVSKPSIDWSLFLRYYDGDGEGNWAPKPEYANSGTWASYVGGAK